VLEGYGYKFYLFDGRGLTPLSGSALNAFAVHESELICGFPRQRSRGPTFYPVACSPQAWAAATPLYLLQSSLGLSFESEANRIVFRRPVLPSFLDEIRLTGLSLPAGKVDVEVRRANRGFVVDVLDRSAAIEVLTIN
jgi:glycogen debranching enzyme